MVLVIATDSELGGLWYPNQSASSSIRPISSLADHELQHRGHIHHNRAIQASLHVKSAVKTVFWLFSWIDVVLVKSRKFYN